MEGYACRSTDLDPRPILKAYGQASTGRTRGVAESQELGLAGFESWGSNALVKVDHILVDHADAAGGNVRADGPRFDGAVGAVERVLVALPEVSSRVGSLRHRHPGQAYCASVALAEWLC